MYMFLHMHVSRSWHELMAAREVVGRGVATAVGQVEVVALVVAMAAVVKVVALVVVAVEVVARAGVQVVQSTVDLVSHRKCWVLRCSSLLVCQKCSLVQMSTIHSHWY